MSVILSVEAMFIYSSNLLYDLRIVAQKSRVKSQYATQVQ